MKNILITLGLILLLVNPIFIIQAYATKPLTESSYWFECTAGYVVTTIPIHSPLTGRDGFFGIDAYHVKASSFGPDYDIVLYYILFNPSQPSDVEPIAFYISKSIGIPSLPFIPYPELSVTRKGLAISVNNLPSILPPPYTISGIPKQIEVTSNPHLSITGKIQPETIGPLPTPAGQMSIKFKGTWCPVSPTEYFIFNVRVTITLTAV